MHSKVLAVFGRLSIGIDDFSGFRQKPIRSMISCTMSRAMSATCGSRSAMSLATRSRFQVCALA
jgi:hypothetical protein